jgi:uncharacterized protein (TIGR03382 family)
MRLRTFALATALIAGLGHEGGAFVPQKGADKPLVTPGRAPRVHRDLAWKQVGPWRMQLDRDTGVPLRMWGNPIAAAGSVRDAAVAEAAARQFLATHLATLAPGAQLSDFKLLANVRSGDIRTVSFEQRHGDLRVLGSAIGFAFKNDNLAMISSTAMPNVAVRMPGGTLPAATLETSAKAWLAQDGHQVTATGHGERVILPIVRPGGDIEYRVVETVTVEASERDAGRWDVWLDASDGSAVARHPTLMFATGVVLYDVPDRYPGGTRHAQPATNTIHNVDGANVTSAADGTVTWNTASNASIAPGLTGPFVRIINKAGTLITDSLSLAPAGTATWSKATDGPSDAQVDAFIFAAQAKKFVHDRLNPQLAYLDQQLSVNVNENQTCNAYSTGDDIHFFRAGQQCENTGRISDVVYHEFGHSVHANSIIPGVGNFDSALSEGLADTLGVSMTGDHGMGRGFFFNNAPLRDVDPAGIEKKWGVDTTGEPHDDGEIIGETLWDLRTALEAKYGQAAGFDKFLHIYYSIMQRATDIPSSYGEALLADDNDGNLANGTPNQCEINTTFGLHGLADPAATLGIQPPTRDNYTVSITVTPPETSSACPPPGVQSGILYWNRRGASDVAQIPLVASGTTWSATIPTQEDGTVIEYTVTLSFADGSSIQYPDNPADRHYQMYVGNVTKLWCADFEAGIGDWTHSGNPVTRDEWQAGPPLGVAGDPKSAHGGANVLGIDLGSNDGLYRPGTQQWAESPDIDLQGHTQVRLQYYRWLNVEDGGCDQATIMANGESVWTNAATACQTSGINHTDKEWRFQDVDLSAQAATGKIKLKFELDSDPGLELGGWTMDDVCIVTAGAPSATCGNGTVDTGETCDDGNTTAGDGCSATCQDETTMTPGDDGGCCSTGTKPGGPIVLALATLGLVIRRRRR